MIWEDKEEKEKMNKLRLLAYVKHLRMSIIDLLVG